jgi:hypothetical protein
MQPFIFAPWMWRDPGMLVPGWPGEVDDRPDAARSDDEARPTGTDERSGVDLTGYKVEASDGGIGSIDEATYDVGAACLVVDTGPWIFGRKVLLPAGTVQRIDHDERAVYVDRTRDQIKNSPEYDKETFGSGEYRERVGTYYDDSYRTSPPAV